MHGFLKTMNKNDVLKQQIATLLFNNTGRMDNLGLLDGKMGICIFFFHLAKRTEEKIYQDFAETMIKEICGEIYLALSPNFGWGIPGIGWGLEYILQNNLIQVDAKDVLKEFDTIVSGYLSDIGTKPDAIAPLLGFAVYFLQRTKNKVSSGQGKENFQRMVSIFNMLELIIEKSFGFVDRPKQWQLLWTFPLCVWFLFECHVHNLFSHRIEKITNMLVNYVTSKSSEFSKLHRNRLLLLWSVSKTSKGSATLSNLKELILEKCACVKKEKIALELPENDFTLSKGTSGITWLYHELYTNTGKEHYKKAADYWLARTLEILGSIKLADFVRKNTATSYGLLTGLAGVGLVLLKVTCNDKKDHSFLQ